MASSYMDSPHSRSQSSRVLMGVGLLISDHTQHHCLCNRLSTRGGQWNTAVQLHTNYCVPVQVNYVAMSSMILLTGPIKQITAVVNICRLPQMIFGLSHYTTDIETLGRPETQQWLPAATTSQQLVILSPCESVCIIAKCGPEDTYCSGNYPRNCF